MEELKLNPVTAIATPVLMRWDLFADWVGVSPDTVRGWLDRGYIPALTIGKHRMVNVALLSKQLLEGAM